MSKRVNNRSPIAERLAARSVPTEAGCLEYQSKNTQKAGHRRIGYQNKYLLVHRVAWELAHGPIPDGVEIHHTCRNLACIKIEHLVIGSLKERLRKKFAFRARSMPNGCVEYSGATSTDFGYARIEFEGKRELAHRLAWELVNGPIPDGLIVRHSCDNPPCVNVKHLSLGTHYDNALDCSIRGRRVTKLTSDQVYELRKLSANGVKSAELADKFGVTSGTINNICARRRWKHLPEVSNG